MQPVAEVKVKQRSLTLLIVSASLSVLMSLSLSISMYLAECHANHMTLLQELDELRFRRPKHAFAAGSREAVPEPDSLRWSLEQLDLLDDDSEDQKSTKARDEQIAAVHSSLHETSQLRSVSRIREEKDPIQVLGLQADDRLHESASSNETFLLDATSPPFVLFYHIYIPRSSDGEGIDNAIRIVEEQIGQVGRSFAASVPNTTLTLFYNTVGLDLLNATFMDNLCWEKHKIRCMHLRHYDNGYEETTLSSVSNFCHSHKDMRVIYMHSKGSYHSSGKNDRLRQYMTQAVTSDMCLQPPDESCNLCGLQFSANRGLFVPGNFWVAKCDYVNRLLSPQDFAAKLTEIVKDAQLMKVRKQLVMKLFRESPSTLGIDRYASEFWVGSHPSVLPCDLSKIQDFKHWLSKNRDTKADFEWSMAPRHNPFINNRKIRAREDLRIREYFLLAGNLVKWQHLYAEFPDTSSWIWSWFPDGKKWQEAVERHGFKAVEVMTAPLI